MPTKIINKVLENLRNKAKSFLNQKHTFISSAASAKDFSRVVFSLIDRSDFICSGFDGSMEVLTDVASSVAVVDVSPCGKGQSSPKTL